MSADRLQAWIVDDDQSVRWVLEQALTQADIGTRTFERAEHLLAAIGDDEPDVLITDVRMPGMSGIALLKRLHDSRPDLPIIVITAHSDLENAVAAYKGGAFEYLPKPFDIDEAVELVRRAARKTNGSDDADAQHDALTSMIGQAPAMQEVFRSIGRLAGSSMTVLITGESGTGKELVAQALHEHSPRADKPFVALNTSAIAAELLESELFGHEKGAFTGAIARKRGKFELADRGTIFLDEIADMSLKTQAKVLRILQEHKFERVGGTETIEVDVRVIAATNKDLEKEIEAGHFREDLYYRLAVIPFHVPPLRERREDIPSLVQAFVEEFCADSGTRAVKIAPRAMSLLQGYAWPGNVRELRNLTERLVLMSPGARITPDDLPDALRDGDARALEGQTLDQARRAFERDYLVGKLREHGWNVSRTAEAVGLARESLSRKIRALEIERG